MKKFFAEFKTFITRGNIVDMAVGVIVGSSFTAIVNSLSNNIFKPLINYLLTLIFGANSLSEVYTFLIKVNDPTTGDVDLTQSIYIDWGTFINAVINFLLVAIVLFSIVKLINALREGQKKIVADLVDDFPSKEEYKEMKKAGINLRDEAAVAKFHEEKQARIKAEAELKKAEEEEKARLERLANPTTEDLLKKLIEIVESK